MFAALAAFSLLGIFAKIADLRNCRPASLYMLLFVCASLLAAGAALAANQPLRRTPGLVVWVALPFGVCAALAGLAFQTGIRYGEIATSWLIINLSAAIPTLGSILLYREPVSARKIVALLLMAASVLLLWKDKLEDQRKATRQAGATGS
jgi:drug/metabolite transporter (DMT)-like permease